MTDHIDGLQIDLDSEDWGEYKDILTRKQKLFVLWVTTPFQEAHGDWTKAAMKAGYTKKSAYKARFELFRNQPAIAELVKRFDERMRKVGLKQAADKLIDQKLKRATYNIKDYIEISNIENPETGETRQITSIKPINELTREEASIIDNVEITNTGIPTYKLPNREKEANDIIKLASESNKETTNEGYDVETTVDMVKEQLATVKTTIRFNNQKVKENAENYIENSENQPEFD